ncbi:MAG: tetratricopeptide repeat protein, partial [Flavobacteriales bacterium]|nr:tetratricopeptide repeat protein [Flavobacteriales bacterium]
MKTSLKYTYWFIFFIWLCISCNKSTYVADNSKKEGSKLSERKEMEFKRLFINASKEKMLKNFDKARALYERCLDIDPKSDAAHYELAALYKKDRNLKEAMSHINSSLKYDEDNKWYYLFKASLFEEQMQYENAAKVYKTLVGKHESLEYYYLLATTQFFAGDLKESLES